MKDFQSILPHDGDVRFYPVFFSANESDRYKQELQHTIDWKQRPIKIYGKEVLQPRLTAWYGDAGKLYSYSGITMAPLPWTDTLLQIKQRIETVAPVTFNSALLNLYRDQNDSMGWHRDNERELGIDPVIASVSFGAARTFQFRNYKEKTEKYDLELTHGSLLLMQGKTQHVWEHGLPRRSRAIAARINITFRVIKDI
ncbi:MAG TPA: alpha-ketoglutarate-dependent dioxygenase AlkB [Ohtaekwangia sp.]|uniref:alpha-ketoglutarate-dependent dioxygenase AlkB family protein n=1 Tax=Ohtaekwangia sp. TaxID=2066019 RepID=UPI002F9226C4